MPKVRPVIDECVRLQSGVKKRHDGQGDLWAEHHRQNLGRDFLMHDIDGCFGAVVFGHNTAERLFLEYVPDNYENRLEYIREFAVVGLFDRKRSFDWAMSNGNRLSMSVYLYLCRSIAKTQPIAPRFFLLFGEHDKPPWEMIELDIETGEVVPREPVVITDATNWYPVWDTALGLTKMRNELRQWIDPPKPT